MHNYKTRAYGQNESWRVDSNKLVLRQYHLGGEYVVAAVRRVKVYGRDDQLQIALEKTIPGKKRTTTHHISLVLEGEWIGKFIEACQVEWKPEGSK